MINIPPARLKSGDETVVSMVSIPENGALLVHAGKRYKVLKGDELAEYQGERGRRGKMLPQGYQHVSYLEVKD